MRLSGIVFVAGAVFGLIISAGGLIGLWTSKAGVTGQATGMVVLANSTLTVARELNGANITALEAASKNMDSIDEMVSDLAGMLEESSSTASSASSIVGGDMVNFVDGTKASLDAVQNSAKAVDAMLNKINAIPLLGPWLGSGYDPDVPLQSSVAEVSRSLDALPEALSKISRDLDVSSANIATIQAEIEVLDGQVSAIQKSLDGARSAASQYQALLGEMQERCASFEARLPGMIDSFYATITLFLVWMVVSQAGMLVYGAYLLR